MERNEGLIQIKTKTVLCDVIQFCNLFSFEQLIFKMFVVRQTKSVPITSEQLGPDYVIPITVHVICYQPTLAMSHLTVL